MNKLNFASLLFVMIVTATACSKDKDDKQPEDFEDPVITLTSPEEDTAFPVGAELSFSANVSDNIALDHLVVSLVYHGVIKSSGEILKSDPETWSPDPHIFELDGISTNFVDEPLFGESISETRYGYYILKFELTDKAGNQTSEEVMIIL